MGFVMVILFKIKKTFWN